MNVGDPNGAWDMQTRESDMLVVVKKPEKVKAGGAKGHYCKGVFSNNQQTALTLKSLKTAKTTTQGCYSE